MRKKALHRDRSGSQRTSGDGIQGRHRVSGVSQMKGTPQEQNTLITLEARAELDLEEINTLLTDGQNTWPETFIHPT